MWTQTVFFTSAYNTVNPSGRVKELRHTTKVQAKFELRMLRLHVTCRHMIRLILGLLHHPCGPFYPTLKSQFWYSPRHVKAAGESQVKLGHVTASPDDIPVMLAELNHLAIASFKSINVFGELWGEGGHRLKQMRATNSSQWFFLKCLDFDLWFRPLLLLPTLTFSQFLLSCSKHISVTMLTSFQAHVALKRLPRCLAATSWLNIDRGQ